MTSLFNNKWNEYFNVCLKKQIEGLSQTMFLLSVVSQCLTYFRNMKNKFDYRYHGNFSPILQYEVYNEFIVVNIDQKHIKVIQGHTCLLITMNKLVFINKNRYKLFYTKINIFITCFLAKYTTWKESNFFTIIYFLITCRQSSIFANVQFSTIQLHFSYPSLDW